MIKNLILVTFIFCTIFLISDDGKKGLPVKVYKTRKEMLKDREKLLDKLRKVNLNLNKGIYAKH